MADYAVYMISVVILLLGVMAAEYLTFRIFGRPKKYLVIIDVVLFALVTTALYSMTDFGTMSPTVYAFNFFVGFVAIIVIRSIEAGLGATEKIQTPEGAADKLLPVLVKAGLDSEEIKNVMKGFGVSPQAAEKMESKIDKSVPPYLPKIVRIYDELEEIKARLEKIATLLEKRKPKRTKKPRDSKEQEHSDEEPKQDPLSGMRHIIQAAIERTEEEKQKILDQNKDETPTGSVRLRLIDEPDY